MRKGPARLLLGGCATMLTAAMGTTSALAATTWTITPGAAITANPATIGARFAVSPPQAITSP